jgi:hypothetical protein
MFIDFFAGSKFKVEVQTLLQKYVIFGNTVYRVCTFEVVEIKPMTSTHWCCTLPQNIH